MHITIKNSSRIHKVIVLGNLGDEVHEPEISTILVADTAPGPAGAWADTVAPLASGPGGTDAGHDRGRSRCYPG